MILYLLRRRMGKYSTSVHMCDLRLPPGLQYEVVTFGLLPSVTFLWLLTYVSGPYIRRIFRVQ